MNYSSLLMALLFHTHNINSLNFLYTVFILPITTALVCLLYLPCLLIPVIPYLYHTHITLFAVIAFSLLNAHRVHYSQKATNYSLTPFMHATIVLLTPKQISLHSCSKHTATLAFFCFEFLFITHLTKKQ